MILLSCRHFKQSKDINSNNNYRMKMKSKVQDHGNMHCQLNSQMSNNLDIKLMPKKFPAASLTPDEI